MPSWEQIVDRVTVKSNYFNVHEAARGWERVFQRLDELRGDLEDLSKKSESWTGGAADAFRKHLKTHVDNLAALADDHRRIVHGLDACHDHLQQAVNSIEIPTWMYSDVESKQQAYHQGGEIPGYSPGSFQHGYLKYVMGDMYSNIPLVGDAWKAVDGWIRDREANAQAAYTKLCGDYSGEYQNIPEGSQRTSQGVFNPTDVNPTSPSVPNSPGKPPTLGHGETPNLKHGPTPTGLPGPHAGGNPSLPDPSSADPPYSGLAGATPGGFTGAGLGGSGLAGVPGGGIGGALGGGAGLGGLGGGAGIGALPGGAAGLAGRGLPTLGPSVAPTGLGGALGAGGAGAGGRGAGGRGAGMLGGAHGGGDSYGDEDDRSTWLQEDDDVWGAGNNAPPPVIGG